MTRKEWEPVEEGKQFGPVVAGPTQASVAPTQPTGAGNVVAGEGVFGSIIGSTLDIPGKGVTGMHVDSSGNMNLGPDGSPNIEVTAAGAIYIGNGADFAAGAGDPSSVVAPFIQFFPQSGSYIIQALPSGTGMEQVGAIRFRREDATSGYIEMLPPGPTGSTQPLVRIYSDSTAASARVEIDTGTGGGDVTIYNGVLLSSYLKFEDVATGYIELTEQSSAPAAPAANGVRIYAIDNGAGKTQLMALFSSGAAQQLAIQP